MSADYLGAKGSMCKKGGISAHSMGDHSTCEGSIDAEVTLGF